MTKYTLEWSLWAESIKWNEHAADFALAHYEISESMVVRLIGIDDV